MTANLKARFGEFGGQYVPQILLPALDQLEEVFEACRADESFMGQYRQILADYLGRPTPLTKVENAGKGAQIYLKREDLVHGGAHKGNQVIGQALLAKAMGKKRIIAETGAGQHGTATAMVCARLGLECEIYMGYKDIARQAANVYRMELMGAKVTAVDAGDGTLKAAVNQALRDWSASYKDTHYLLGTAAGPHPFPTIVKEFQRVISTETKRQIVEHAGRLPDTVVACVGGGSNAIGMFADFIDEPGVQLVGVEPAGKGLHTGEHGAAIQAGQTGVLHGAHTFVMADESGQVRESYSISAGLDYPAVGPEHAHLARSGRAQYVTATDSEALAAFHRLSREEGIIPALESSHALAWAYQEAANRPEEDIIVVCLSGRGDKDVDQIRALEVSH